MPVKSLSQKVVSQKLVDVCRLCCKISFDGVKKDYRSVRSMAVSVRRLLQDIFGHRVSINWPPS